MKREEEPWAVGSPYVDSHTYVNRNALDLASLMVETFFYDLHSSLIYK